MKYLPVALLPPLFVPSLLVVHNAPSLSLPLFITPQLSTVNNDVSSKRKRERSRPKAMHYDGLSIPQSHYSGKINSAVGRAGWSLSLLLHPYSPGVCLLCFTHYLQSVSPKSPFAFLPSTNKHRGRGTVDDGDTAVAFHKQTWAN